MSDGRVCCSKFLELQFLPGRRNFRIDGRLELRLVHFRHLPASDGLPDLRELQCWDISGRIGLYKLRRVLGLRSRLFSGQRGNVL